MADQKPPHRIGDDRGTLQLLLQYQRDSIVRKVDGVSDDDARRSPVASGTSLLWLVQHLAHAELLWVVHRFAGQPLDAPATDSLADAIAGYRDAWARVDAVIASADLDAPCPAVPTVDLRWIVAHLVEETARHAGHADILRELVDGQTGR